VDSLRTAAFRTVAAVLVMYGLMFGVGAVLLLKWTTALVMVGMTLVGWAGLRRYGTGERTAA
jgi:hypothetical protein